MSSDEQLDALWNDPPVRRVARPAVATPSTSYSSDPDAEAAAEGGGATATAEGEQMGDAMGDAATRPALPSAEETFGEVTGPPAFLDPEATRKLASLERLPPSRPSVLAAAHRQADSRDKRDISRMAPPLPAADELGGNAGVITAAPVRYKGDQDGLAQAAQASGRVATASGRAPGAVAAPDKGAAKRKATGAMPVEELLAKGVGGAQLPRKRQDRKEKEKEKRGKGQSTHAEWKSEAEMALRQQYD